MAKLPQFPGAAMAWLAQEFGGLLSENESVPATGAATVSVIGNDPDSLAITFVNFGGFDIFLTLTAKPTASSGIKLVANGGAVSLVIRDDLTLVTREWFATSPGGASSLYVLRLRKQGGLEDEGP